MLNNSNYGGPFLFPLFAVIPDDQSVKNVHDAYDVYVNDDFIGKKELVAETEDIENVLDFIRKSGVENAFAELKGDHYIVRLRDEDELEHVKQILKVYLSNR